MTRVTIFRLEVWRNPKANLGSAAAGGWVGTGSAEGGRRAAGVGVPVPSPHPAERTPQHTKKACTGGRHPGPARSVKTTATRYRHPVFGRPFPSRPKLGWAGLGWAGRTRWLERLQRFTGSTSTSRWHCLVAVAVVGHKRLTHGPCLPCPRRQGGKDHLL